jgi:hypothetical protein
MAPAVIIATRSADKKAPVAGMAARGAVSAVLLLIVAGVAGAVQPISRTRNYIQNTDFFFTAHQITKFY